MSACSTYFSCLPFCCFRVAWLSRSGSEACTLSLIQTSKRSCAGSCVRKQCRTMCPQMLWPSPSQPQMLMTCSSSSPRAPWLPSWCASAGTLGFSLSRADQDGEEPYQLRGLVRSTFACGLGQLGLVWSEAGMNVHLIRPDHELIQAISCPWRCAAHSFFISNTS